MVSQEGGLTTVIDTVVDTDNPLCCANLYASAGPVTIGLLTWTGPTVLEWSFA